jgi:hypothetical protein
MAIGLGNRTAASEEGLKFRGATSKRCVESIIACRPQPRSDRYFSIKVVHHVVFAQLKSQGAAGFAKGLARVSRPIRF